MLSQPQADLALFLAIVILGVFAVAVATKQPRRSHKKGSKQFNFKRYILHMLFPMLAVVLAYQNIGTPVVYVFIAGAVAGLVLEYLVGASFSFIEGARLWRYYHYDISGNTSWLVLPIWGMAGVMCLLIARMFI